MSNLFLPSSSVLETIDERLLRCGVNRRKFLQFCSSLMVAGLAVGALVGAGYVASQKFSKVPDDPSVPGLEPPAGAGSTTPGPENDPKIRL